MSTQIRRLTKEQRRRIAELEQFGRLDEAVKVAEEAYTKVEGKKKMSAARIEAIQKVEENIRKEVTKRKRIQESYQRTKERLIAKAKEIERRRKEKAIRRKEKFKVAFRETLNKLKQRRIQKYGTRVRNAIDHSLIEDNQTNYSLLFSLDDIRKYVNEIGDNVGAKGLLRYIRDKVLMMKGTTKLIKLNVGLNGEVSDIWYTLRPDNVESVINGLMGEINLEEYPDLTSFITSLQLDITNHKDIPKVKRSSFLPYCIYQEDHDFDYKPICKMFQIAYCVGRDGDGNDIWDNDHVPVNCLSYTLRQYGPNYYVNPNYMVNSTVRQRDLGHVAKDNNIHIRVHYVNAQNKQRADANFNEGGGKLIRIANHHEHYFVYEKVVKYPGGFGNSIKVLRWMLANGVLQPMSYSMLMEMGHAVNIHNYEVPYIDNPEKFCRYPAEKPAKRLDTTYVCYIDTETDTSGNKHKAQVMSVSVTYNNVTKKYYDTNVEGIFKWLAHLPNLTKEKYGKRFIVYAHNLRYDASFLIQYTGLGTWFGEVGNCKGYSARYGTFVRGIRVWYNFEFRDSKALLNMPLAKFNDALKLGEDCDKLDFPYASYNIGRPLKYSDYATLDSMNENTKNKDINELRRVVKKAGALMMINDVECVKMLDFTKYYCDQDVNILQKGIEKFRQMVIDNWGIDAHLTMTLPSLAKEILKKVGALEGICEISGPVLNFVQKALHGGICMVRGGRKIHTTEPIAYIDITSHYPNAMVQLGGLPVGYPKVIPDGVTYQQLCSYTSYVVCIDIIELVRPDYHFPMVVVPTKKGQGSKIYDDTYRGEIVAGKIALEDLIRFAGLKKFNVIGGYYWDEGRNMKLGECIQGIFNERKKYDKEHPLNLIMKEVINSAYGKFGMKAHKKGFESKWFKNDKDRDEYIYKRSHAVNSFVQSGNMSIIEYSKPSLNHFNMCHCSIEILDMSKRKVYRMRWICKKFGIKIYYGDTDSLMIQKDKLDLLASEYEKEFGEQFMGNDLGQVHLDFAKDGTGNKMNNVYASESYFLERKCYCLRVNYECGEHSHKVNGVDVPCNGKHEYFQYKMRSIPHMSLVLDAKELGVDMMGLYKKLYEGNKMDFDLLEKGNRVRFEYQKDFSVRSVREFKRSLQFIKPRDFKADPESLAAVLQRARERILATSDYTNYYVREGGVPVEEYLDGEYESDTGSEE